MIANVAGDLAGALTVAGAWYVYWLYHRRFRYRRRLTRAQRATLRAFRADLRRQPLTLVGTLDQEEKGGWRT